MPNPHAHCGHCGTPFANLAWPRTCTKCEEQTWRNPTPVVVGLIRTASKGVVVIERGIEPFKGGLALPGGFQEIETWEQALDRELEEELEWKKNAQARGRTIPELRFHIFDVLSSTTKGQLLLFAYTDEVDDSYFNELPPTAEAQKILIVHTTAALCFATHSWVLAEVLQGNVLNAEHLRLSPRPA